MELAQNPRVNLMTSQIYFNDKLFVCVGHTTKHSVDRNKLLLT